MDYLAYICLGIAAVVFLETVHKIRRAVTRSDSCQAIVENAVTPWMLRGFNGTRAIAFNPTSGSMVQSVKSLEPRWSLHGQVRLRVLKSQVPQDDCLRFEKTIRKRMKGASNTARLWCWTVPSPRESQVLQEISCGASISMCLEEFSNALKEVMREDPSRTFYVWCERGISTYVAGRFD